MARREKHDLAYWQSKVTHYVEKNIEYGYIPLLRELFFELDLALQIDSVDLTADEWQGFVVGLNKSLSQKFGVSLQDGLAEIDNQDGTEGKMLSFFNEINTHFGVAEDG